MSGSRDQPVKIVLIHTQYVETDARSFKSVVQELTGKDSGGRTREAKSTSKKRMMIMKREEEEMMNVNGASAGAGAGAGAGASRVQIGRNGSILMRDLSFKELDILLKETPVDELYGLWSN